MTSIAAAPGRAPAAATPTCSARVGYFAGEWAEMPIFCSATVGLIRYTDTYGIERRACRHHKAEVLYRYPVKPASNECHICHRTLTDDDWRTFDDNGRIYAVCGVCQDKGDEG